MIQLKFKTQQDYTILTVDPVVQNVAEFSTSYLENHEKLLKTTGSV